MNQRCGPDAQCPIRPGEPCTLCQLDVSGPQDCPLVYLVMTDPELRDKLHEHRKRALAARAAMAAMAATAAIRDHPPAGR